MDASPVTSTEEMPFTFSGRAGEYFGIWIVNVLLIIITLGIYTAWAKVRTNRYFYGHTLLDNSPFDYLANPIAILIGWVIGVVIFISYSLAVNFFPLIAGLLALLVFLFVPWFVVRAMAFRLRNTAHRNIRFMFNKNYSQAALAFLGLPLLLPFTLGLIFPYMVFRQKKFIVDNSNYGQSGFGFAAGAGGFYKIAFIALGIMLGALVLVTTLGAGLGTALAASGAGEAAGDMANLLIMLPLLLVYVVLLAYWQTAVTNLIWNNVQLEQHQFRSRLNVGYMLWLYSSNTLAILCSLGLLIPWARVRTARYRVSKLSFIPGANLNAFLAARQEEENAIGEQVGEIMDIDIGL
ncbi:MAG: YjgN family protein [Gammaproteobacteria bacterium]